MTETPIRVAMIGGGLNSAVGRTHEIAMKLDNAFALQAGCFSRDGEINQRSAQAYGVEPSRVYASAEQLLQAERHAVQAVVIATPIDSHAHLINMALDAGLTVICDKPLLATTQECHALLERVAPDSCRVFSIFNYTGYPAVREIKQRVAAGEIGDVFKIMAEMPQDSYLRLRNADNVAAIQAWRLKDGSVPCLSLDLFAHIHSLVAFISGQRPVSVSARSRAISGVSAGLIDEVDAIVEYDEGMVLNAWYGKVALGCRNGLRLRIFGSKGSFEWIQEQPETLVHANALGDRSIIDRITTSSSITPALRYNRFKAGHPAGFIEAFANYYADIAQAIHSNKLNAYTLPVSLAVEGVDVCAAIHAASLSRGEIVLP